VTTRYRILDRLGEGGMGVVYSAEDIRLGRHVALKFLPAPASEIPSTILRRFEREARAASSVNHPHICTMYGLDDFDGQPVIAMELVHGETLSSRQARGRIPRDEALRMDIEITMKQLHDSEIGCTLARLDGGWSVKIGPMNGFMSEAQFMSTEEGADFLDRQARKYCPDSLYSLGPVEFERRQEAICLEQEGGAHG
jgi:hypothetical protein